MAQQQQEASKIKFFKLSPHATIPSRSSVEAAGLDLHSAFYQIIPPLGKGIISTDLIVAIPDGNLPQHRAYTSRNWRYGRSLSHAFSSAAQPFARGRHAPAQNQLVQMDE